MKEKLTPEELVQEVTLEDFLGRLQKKTEAENAVWTGTRLGLRYRDGTSPNEWRCPIAFVFGGPTRDAYSTARLNGMDHDDAVLIIKAADNDTAYAPTLLRKQLRKACRMA